MAYLQPLNTFRATRRPQRVREMASHLLEILKVDEFAALHWRYDEEDFIEKQSGKELTKKRWNIYYVRKNPQYLCNAIEVTQSDIHQKVTTL